MLLMARQFVHIRQLPSFLGTRMTGIRQGLMLSWTQPLSNNPSTCFWISLVSSGLVLYAGRSGKEATGIKSIWCLVPFKGGKPLGGYWKKSLNSFNKDSKHLEISREELKHFFWISYKYFLSSHHYLFNFFERDEKARFGIIMFFSFHFIFYLLFLFLFGLHSLFWREILV